MNVQLRAPHHTCLRERKTKRPPEKVAFFALDLMVHLQEILEYMPPTHRIFLQTLKIRTDDQGRALLSGYVHDRKQRHPELWSA